VTTSSSSDGRTSHGDENRHLNLEPADSGQLFRLFADRCDDLRFPRSRSLDGCGRLMLFRRYLVSKKCLSDHTGGSRHSADAVGAHRGIWRR